MFKRLVLSAISIVILSHLSFSQKHSNDDILLWSDTRKLSVNDFLIRIEQIQTIPCFAQFSMEYSINGFDFMTRNFNKKVRNCFIKSASWIDTTINVSQSILYQQTLFDISEIYTRRFRKDLRNNKKYILKGGGY